MWRSVANRRGLWFLLFMISGLPAFFSVILLPFGGVDVIPWLVLTWSVLILSGYRIWRIDHPYESAPGKIGRLLYLFVSFTVGAVGLAILQANPLVLVVILGGWLIVMALLGLALWSISRPAKEN
jgi:hypothetical protein